MLNRVRGEDCVGGETRNIWAPHCAVCAAHDDGGKQLSQTAAAATGLDTNNVETCGLFLLFDNIAFCGFNTSIESIE